MPKNVTISVSDELAKKMDEMRDVNWSEVCRKAISDYIQAREPDKGEIIADLEKYLKSTVPVPTSEAREALRDAELKRFTRKWGKPDIVGPDDSPGAKPPYIILQKNVEIKHGDIQVNLRIFNSVRAEYSPRQYSADEWKSVKHIADYLKTTGFSIVEMPFLQDDVRNLVTAFNKEQARELLRRYEYYGLFAHDKEDTVFLGYREVKRP